MCLNFYVFTVLWKCSELLCTCPSELWTWIIVFFFETVNYCLLLLSAIYVWEKQPSLMCWRAGSILSHWIWFGGMDGGGKLRCDLLKASHWIPVQSCCGSDLVISVRLSLNDHSRDSIMFSSRLVKASHNTSLICAIRIGALRYYLTCT